MENTGLGSWRLQHFQRLIDTWPFLYVFLLKDTLLNMYYWLTNIELTANHTSSRLSALHSTCAVSDSKVTNKNTKVWKTGHWVSCGKGSWSKRAEWPCCVSPGAAGGGRCTFFAALRMSAMAAVASCVLIFGLDINCREEADLPVRTQGQWQMTLYARHGAWRLFVGIWSLKWCYLPEGLLPCVCPVLREASQEPLSLMPSLGTLSKAESPQRCAPSLQSVSDALPLLTAPPPTWELRREWVFYPFLPCSLLLLIQVAVSSTSKRLWVRLIESLPRLWNECVPGKPVRFEEANDV